MHIYKELSLLGDKTSFDTFKENAPSFAKGDWRYFNSNLTEHYIAFDYLGNKADEARVLIYYGPETWRDGFIKVVNIVPLRKNELTIDEYNAVLDLFYKEVILPNKTKMKGLTVIEPETDVFDPLKYISKEALAKLELFCNGANKTTGSSHPSDEARWFDFICQTVDDGQTFDFDTIFRFLMDEDYWGKRDPKFIGSMGHFAWDEEQAGKLATEYDDYVRILKFYRNKKWQEEYEAAQI